MSQFFASTIHGCPRLSACLWVMATLMAATCHASAADFNATWDGASGLLPDAVCPGWVLTDTASPEEPTLSNGRLRITTSANGENIFYAQSGPAISVPGLMVIEVRLRFVSGTTSHVARTPAVVGFAVSPTVGNGLLIGADEVFLLAADLLRGPSAAVDTNDGFHTYRLEVNTSTGAINVFYDGNLLLSGTTFSDPNTNGTEARVFFGEGSIFATGTTEWEFVRHNASTTGLTDSDGDGVGDACDADDDNDTVVDTSDNCPLIANTDQADNDGDTLGDVCDPDDDNDGVADASDNCPFVANTDQADFDGDGHGDACDADLDGDGVLNDVDNCPLNPNPDQSDTDGDGTGDACDSDDDNDGAEDLGDNCPTAANPDQADLDGDNIGNACDADLDGDGVLNAVDNCPLVSNLGQDDTDGDGAGDSCEQDDDNDGVDDGSDNCPLIVNPDQADTDGDGQGNACDGDLDGDGVSNELDNCPTSANSAQNDFDGDGVGDVCDADLDDDGVGNAPDLCAFTPLGEVVDPATGCSIAQLVPCTGPLGTTEAWKNHGQYVSRVAKTAQTFVALGLITEAQKDEIVSAAAQSNCGQ